jgi:hypothetical protein
MSTIRSPEIQEVSVRSRPWSIGSQLLGHYDAGRMQQPQGGFSSSDRSESRSLNNAVVHTHDVTNHFLNVEQSRSGTPPTRDVPSLDGKADDGSKRPLLRTSTTLYDRIVTDWWWWELLSLLVSLLSISTIVGILLLYSEKKQPDHVIPGVTLNAFISVFAAVAKAALILPVSEAIGQLKWIWFRDQAKLWDFYLFDGASRGPWGSFILLWRTKCRLVSH